MTTEAPKGPPRDKLYVTDDELIYLIGVPERIARPALQELDRDHRRTGFPQRSKLWGDRRYWPAVKAFFDNQPENRIAAPQSQERRRYG